MDEKATSPGDPKAIVRTAGYRRLLVLAAVVGFFVSLAAWAFLTMVPWTQDRVYVTIPYALGFSDATLRKSLEGPVCGGPPRPAPPPPRPGRLKLK